MIAHVGIFLTAMLAFLSAEGVAVALFRILRIAQGMPIQQMRPSALNPRALLLWAFVVYLAGSIMREAVVMRYGIVMWPETAIVASAAARMVQIFGVALFVGALTYRDCEFYVVSGSLGLAAVFATAMMVAL